jgi:hypothetical protein
MRGIPINIDVSTVFQDRGKADEYRGLGTTSRSCK